MTHHGKARENFIKGCEKCPSIRLPHLPHFPSICAINSRLLIGGSRVRIPHGAPQNASSLGVIHLLFFDPLHTHTFPFPYQWGVRGSAPSICGSWLIAGSIPASRRVHFSFFSFLYPRPAVRHAAGRHTGYTDKPSSGASPESRISNT